MSDETKQKCIKREKCSCLQNNDSIKQWFAVVGLKFTIERRNFNNYELEKNKPAIQNSTNYVYDRQILQKSSKESTYDIEQNAGELPYFVAECTKKSSKLKFVQNLSMKNKPPPPSMAI